VKAPGLSTAHSSPACRPGSLNTTVPSSAAKSHYDTSVFAVATIDKWWQQFGKEKYPDARRILITADGGGSNGHRPWLWKFELARLAKKTGLHITVCHYPPGTSKWSRGRDCPCCDTQSHVVSELVEEVRHMSKT
jgi:hypothetical protein